MLILSNRVSLNKIHRWLKKFLEWIISIETWGLRCRVTDAVQVKNSWGPRFYPKFSCNSLHTVGDTAELGTNTRALLSGSLIFFLNYCKSLTYTQGICLPQGRDNWNTLIMVNNTCTPVEYSCYMNIKSLLGSLAIYLVPYLSWVCGVNVRAFRNPRSPGPL